MRRVVLPSELIHDNLCVKIFKVLSGKNRSNDPNYLEKENKDFSNTPNYDENLIQNVQSTDETLLNIIQRTLRYRLVHN